MPKIFGSDSISSNFDRVPPGHYAARLVLPEPTISKSGKPMIEASWIVLLGEHRGTTVKSWYSLTYSESKKGGKPFAGGLSDMAAGAASVGNPITERIPLVANTEVVSELEALQIATTAAKVFKSHLGGISVELVVKEEPNKDEPERPYTRVVVVGPYEIEESSVTSPTEPSVDFFA